MFDSLLLPTDGSDGIEAVFEQVLDIAASHNATLHILHVADTSTESRGQPDDTVEQQGETLVAEAANRATDRGLGTETAVAQGRVPQKIAEYAAEAGVDCIVMPTHGRTGLEEHVLGSTTERVSRQTTVPVLTLRPKEPAITYPFESLLVPTDGSDPATIALKFAVDRASETAATIHLLSAVDTAIFDAAGHTLPHLDAIESQANKVVERAADLAATKDAKSITTAVEQGPSIPAVIRRYATENDIDCIVMGTHGRTGFKRYLIGSVTEAVLRSASVPVWVVPNKNDSG